MPAFTSLPGFREFYPEEMSLRTRIFAAWREAARRFGFDEYDGPPLEPLELYTEKSGDEIVHQLYNFEDKGGRQVALRPEMTPTLARMAGARARSLRKPIRWFAIPQLFRYERTQRGRLREHFQWNVDLIGEDDAGADAEVLSVALEGLRLLGLTASDVHARVNDRRLLQKLLLGAGVPSTALAATYAAIDKLGREPAERTRDRLATDAGLDTDVIDRVEAIFGMSFDQLLAAHSEDQELVADFERMRSYFAALDDAGLADFVTFDPSIVRGLAYYTGIVFEIFDRKGELRAVCGGGRYDNLLGALGGDNLPAVGFGMGDVVLGELLRERGLADPGGPRVDYYIAVVSDAEQPEARRIAAALRGAGHSVILSLRAGGIGKQFKDADARGAREVIVLGPDEIASGAAVVKTLATGEERRVRIDFLAGDAGAGPSANASTS